MARKLILKTFLAPGDICTLTAAIESLHRTYPGQYLTDVRTSCDELFVHNPYITRLADDDAEIIDMHYTDLINCSDQVPNPFLRGYCHYLGRRLNVSLELTTNRPHLFLSDDEKLAHPLRAFGEKEPIIYWLVTAGVKKDFTLKQWPVEYYQQVIDHFRGRIHFVQVGSDEHDHPRLTGVIDLLGATTLRDLVCLAYHAEGGLGPITLLQHLCAAFEKPYIAILGGREPVAWTQYPIQTTLHTIGKLSCCRTRACWRSRVVRLSDGAEQDNSLCEFPVLDMSRPVGKCMTIILPVDVTRAIEASESQRIGDAATVPKLTTWEAESTSCGQGAPAKPCLEIVAYSAWGFDTKIVPASSARDWMDATDNGFAYHCLPMLIANQSGWFILAPHGIVAEWDGGSSPASLKVEIVGTPKAVQAQSNVGYGILTWTIPYVFRTPCGWNLLCRGPANYAKDGLAPLEGLVETDWTFASFSMNWKFTRPGRCEFKEGEPVAMLVPHRRFDLEGFSPRCAELSSNGELSEGYGVWIKSRQEFWEAQKRGDAEVLKQKYQRHYFRGGTNQGMFFLDHQKARHVAPFNGPIIVPPVVESEIVLTDGSTKLELPSLRSSMEPLPTS